MRAMCVAQMLHRRTLFRSDFHRLLFQKGEIAQTVKVFYYVQLYLIVDVTASEVKGNTNTAFRLEKIGSHHFHIASILVCTT